MRPVFTPGRPSLPWGVAPCPCCRWRPREVEHPLGLCADCRVCLHCEQRPTATTRGLCAACADHSDIRKLYRRGRKFDPAWEQYLRQLTRWYQEQLLGHEHPEPPHPAGA